jgi:1-deoxy-D-xylulose-5-phosphate reductoisomerase
MKRIALLGSTGSIGKKTLEVVEDFGGEFRVTALSTHGNLNLLCRQVERFKPEVVNIVDEGKGEEGKRLLKDFPVEVTVGPEGMARIVDEVDLDLLVLATVGSSGLEACLKAIDRGIDIALANKEVLVMAGEIVMARAREKGVQIRPIDSEHNGILQCLEGRDIRDVRRIILTASGGPFRELSSEELESVTLDDALKSRLSRGIICSAWRSTR